MRDRPTSAQLAYLLAAIETGSWTAGAEGLGVTTSAFGQGIRELENRLGLVLFDKVGRKRVPTAEAHGVVEQARRVLGAYEGLDRWVAHTLEGSTGTIRAGMIDTAAIHHFGDALVRFRRVHPELELRLSVRPSAQLIDELRRDEHEVIVSVEPPDSDDLDCTDLVAEPIYVYGPDGAAKVPVEEWGPWVTFPEDSLTRHLAAQTLSAQGVVFNVVAESSQPAVIREMVRLGMGWTVLPAVDAESEPHALRRAVVKPITTRTLSLIRLRDRSPSPALQRFIAMMMSESLGERS